LFASLQLDLIFRVDPSSEVLSVVPSPRGPLAELGVFSSLSSLSILYADSIDFLATMLGPNTSLRRTLKILIFVGFVEMEPDDEFEAVQAFLFEAFDLISGMKEQIPGDTWDWLVEGELEIPRTLCQGAECNREDEGETVDSDNDNGEGNVTAHVQLAEWCRRTDEDEREDEFERARAQMIRDVGQDWRTLRELVSRFYYLEWDQPVLPGFPSLHPWTSLEHLELDLTAPHLLHLILYTSSFPSLVSLVLRDDTILDISDRDFQACRRAITR
jgi:hypothetical protein